MQLGAFYPFSRNHNTINARPQEPYLWESVARASRNALKVRYAMLPFYYTLFYQAHKFGATVVRPLFFEFPHVTDIALYDRQFLVGPSVLISPVLQEHARKVNTFFAPGIWYDWYSHSLVANTTSTPSQGQWMELSAPLDHINVHVRGGHIIPTQTPAMTTAESRLNNFQIVVALDQNGNAAGDLFIDDGESLPLDDDALSYIHFSFDPSEDGYRLLADGIFNYKTSSKLDTIFVLGMPTMPSLVMINDMDIGKSKWSYDQSKKELAIHDVAVSLTDRFAVTISA
jgi:alpha-glucosidase (family GH31 glycosyl hydrolase)